MKKRPGFFVVALLILAPALLVAQDDSSPKDRGSGLGSESRSGPDTGPALSRSIGVQYSSMTGFLPYYRVELMGPLVRNEGLMLEGKLTNDFTVLGDMLSTSLTARFNILPMLSLSLEVPASFLYRYPADFGASIAGSARLSLSNRPDPRDQSQGWVFGAELSSTATAGWTSDSALAAFAALTGSQPEEVLPYQAAGLLEVGFRGSVISPDFELVASYDLCSLTLSDVKSIAVLNLGLGTRERSLVVSAETSLFGRPGDTKLQGQLNWDHLAGGFSLGITEVPSVSVFDYGISLGYRF